MFVAKSRGKKAGLTLISALAFTVIIGTVLAGVGTLAVSHYGRSESEGIYANAVAMAEAGINYELAWISRDPTDASRAHQVGSPFTGSVPGSDGSFTVSVRQYGADCDGGNWAAPEDMCIVSTGTVNGMVRTVRVRGIRKSIFDEYALYADDEGTFSGGGASSGSTEIVGNLGTNGPVTFNGTLNTEIVDGELSLNGSNASSSDTGSNVVGNGDPVILPTVSEIANSLFPGGLAYLAGNNSNANIRQFRSADPALASEPTIEGLTLADVNDTTKFASAGLTASSRIFTDPNNSVPSATSALDAPTGSRFMFNGVSPDGDSTHNVDPFGIQGKRTYFVPPGDYYFHKIDFRSGNSALVMLTHLGRIRIWIDTGNNQQDYLSSNVVFTDMTPSKFRLFYNKCNQLNIGGSSVFPGGFYAVLDDALATSDACTNEENQPAPMMNFTGNSMIYGSVITDYFRVTGGTKVIFPNDGAGSDPTDYSLWFGFKDNWKELPAFSGRPVFTDDTSN